MSIYYTVRLFIDIEPHDYSCLIRKGGNRVHPWGTCHATGPAHRFLWQEEAEEALRLYLSYDPPKIYQKGRVYHVTEEGVGPWVTPQEPSEAPEETKRPLPAHTTSLLALRQGEAFLEATIQDPADENALVDLQVWAAENAGLLLATIKEGIRLKDRLTEIDELVGRRVSSLQEDLGRLQRMVEKKTEQNPVDFFLSQQPHG